MLQAELAKLQTTFAEELGSARARLAVAERRNKDLLENLQSTVRAAHSAKVVERPASLPEPPMVLPKSGDWTGQPETLEQRGQKFQKPQVGSLESTRSHISLGGARSQRQAELWELHSQHRDRSERLARHQHLGCSNYDPIDSFERWTTLWCFWNGLLLFIYIYRLKFWYYM